MIASRVSSSGLYFVSLLFITRYLGPDIYGSITYSIALLTTFNLISDLGINMAHQKRLSEGQDAQQCMQTYVFCKLLLTLSFAVIVLLMIWISNNLYELGFFNVDMGLIYLFLLYFVFLDIGNITLVTYYAEIKTALAEFLSIIEPFVRVPLVIIVSVQGLGSFEVALAYVAGAGAFALMGIVVLIKRGFRFGSPTLLRSYLLFSIPMGAYAVVTIISVNLDKILLGLWWGTTEVGYYSAAQSLLSLLTVIGVAISTIIFPAYSNLISKGDYEGIRKTSMAAERYMAMLVLPIILIIVLFPAEICLLILGLEFPGSAEPMRILAMSVFLNMLNLVYLNLIMALGRPIVTVKIMVASVIVNISLLIVTVPQSLFGVPLLGMGAEGAALSNVVYFILVGSICRYVSMKSEASTGVPYYWVRIVLAVLLTSFMLWVASSIITVSGLSSLLLMGVLGALLFYALLIATKEIQRKDLDFIKSILNPKGMRDYIADEIHR